MNRWLLTAGLMCALVPFATGQSSDPASSDSNVPAGTHPAQQTQAKVVQPTTKPVKIDKRVIENAQKELDNRGYAAGAEDGVMGPKTSAAISKFQADQGLPQTGRLDVNTMEKLNIGGVNTLSSAPADLGRGGKAIGHDMKEGQPVDAGKAAVNSGETFGKKVGKGSKSLAVRGVEKVGHGLSSVGDKIAGKATGTDNDKNEKKDQDQQQSPTQPK